MQTYEIRQYTDSEGKLVTARVSIDSKTLETIGIINRAKISFSGGPDDIKFFGTYTIPHPQLGAMRMEFEFPAGWTLEKCFEEFRTEAEKDFNRIQAEAQKEASAPKIWTPGTGNAGSLVVPE